MTLDYYAHLLIEKSKELEAYKMLLQAYELSIQINGIEHEQTITILNDLGTIECRQGNYNLSIQHLNQALKAGKSITVFFIHSYISTKNNWKSFSFWLLIYFT